MSRDDGFSIMDVSVDLPNDPKVRKLFRHAPDHAAVAFLAYVATMGESWRAGKRVNVDDAWPAIVPFSKPAVEALVHVELLDTAGLIPRKVWRVWFEMARQRRDRARERWARYNASRHADAAPLPRGSDDGPASSVPPVRPPVRPKDPHTPAKRGLRANGENPRSVAAKAREERKRQVHEIRMAYYRGEITEAQQAEQLGALR